MRTIEGMDRAVWRAVAVLTAGTLAVCVVRTILGKGDFPWWHLATLAIAWRMGDCGRAFLAILARLQRFCQQVSATWAGVASRVKSAATFSNSLARKQGRLRRVPALFKRMTEKAA